MPSRLFESLPNVFKLKRWKKTSLALSNLHVFRKRNVVTAAQPSAIRNGTRA